MVNGGAVTSNNPDVICFAKLLISNSVIGTLIGKNGTTINQIRTQTGCTVRVSTSDVNSGPNGFFPGTCDRVVVLSGSRQALEKAILVILTLFSAQSPMSSLDDQAPGPRDGGGQLELRFVVPNSTVSLVIGKGGARINQFRESTGAKIQVSSRESNSRMDCERIVSVSGGSEQVKTAALLIAGVIQEDPVLRDFMYLSYPNTTPTAAAAASGLALTQRSIPEHLTSASSPHRPYFGGSADAYSLQAQSAAAAAASLVQQPPSAQTNIMDCYAEIYLQIPDDYVGSLVGRSGQHLADIRNTSGARVSISQRGELVPGTRDRLVTVTGSIKCVHLAHILIMQRLAELQDKDSLAGGS